MPHEATAQLDRDPSAEDGGRMRLACPEGRADAEMMPCELDRLAGNVTYAARHGNSPKLNTAPPLDGRELRKWQARWRKTHGLNQGLST